MQDDFPNDPSTTGVLILDGDAIEATFETSFDVDWFRIDGLQSHYTYEITIEPLANQQTHHMLFQQFDEHGNFVHFKRFGTAYHLQVNRFSSPAVASFSNFVGVRLSEGQYRISAKTLADDYGQSVGFSAGNAKFWAHTIAFGAIEQVGDRDWFIVTLQQGTTYQFILTGASADSVDTLSDPIVRLYDNQGRYIGGDNDSGPGRGALFTYTPVATQDFYVEAHGLGSAVGSYTLRIPQLNDFEGSVLTDGTIVPDGAPVNGTLTPQDRDWFKTSLKPYYMYKLNSTGSRIRLFDEFGRFVRDADGSTMYYRNDSAKTEFHVEALAGHDYELTIETVDDRGQNNKSAGKLERGSGEFGVLETQGDRDWYAIQLANGVSYYFNVAGTTENAAEDVTLNIHDLEGKLEPDWVHRAADGSTTMKFTPTYDGKFFVDVASQSATSTGVYRVSVNNPDSIPQNHTTDERLRFVDGRAKKSTPIELEGDIDWLRVRLEAGNWYRFTNTGGVFAFRTPDLDFQLAAWTLGSPEYYSDFGKLPGDDQLIYESNNTYLLYAQQSDDYFVIQRSDLGQPSARWTTMQVELGPKPRETSIYYSFLRDSQSVDRRVHFQSSVKGDTIELYSTMPLARFEGDNLVAIPAKTTVELTYEQYTNVHVPRGVGGIGEVFVRGHLYSQTWTAWANIPVYVQDDPLALKPTVQDRSQFGNHITFAFAEDLPAHWSGDSRVNGFAELTAAEKDAVRLAMQRFSENNRIDYEEVAPGAQNDAAEIMLFRSNINQHVLALPPGPGTGGDVILNSGSSVLGDLAEGGQGFYEILRGLGITLGLKELTHVDRRTSIMGLRDLTVDAYQPFPSTPLPIDIRALNTYWRRPANLQDSIYRLTEEPVYRSIVDEGGIDTISAADAHLRATIDLRIGSQSFLGSLNYRPTTFLNGNFTFIEHAEGSPFGDWLSGNHQANHIYGGSGHDTLIGRQGNDMLFGGSQNDNYVFRPGDGWDAVDEQNGNGRDRITISGMHNVNQLMDDFTFQRNGDDLVIRLELDAADDLLNDRITVRNMAQASSRVESLTIRSMTQFIAQASLVNLFAQLADDGQRHRFRLAAGHDQFGQLVTPV